MSQSRLKQLTWNKKGVERMEYFMAEGIAYYVADLVQNERDDQPDFIVDKLRCVQGERLDGKESPDFLGMSIPVAGNIMGNMMAQELMKLLLPPDTIAGIVGDAIERAIKDEEYDREHKDPEEYEIPDEPPRKRPYPNCGSHTAFAANRSSRMARPVSISVTIGSSSSA